MFNRTLTSRLYHRVCCLVLFFMAAAASFNGFYVACHFHEVGVVSGWAPDSFERMVDGTADRPYVYRQMLPTLSNWIDRAVPQSIKTRLYDHQGSGPNAYFNAMSYSPTARNKTYFFRYLVLYLSISSYLHCSPFMPCILCAKLLRFRIPQRSSLQSSSYSWSLTSWTFRFHLRLPGACISGARCVDRAQIQLVVDDSRGCSRSVEQGVLPSDHSYLYPFLRRRSSRLAAFSASRHCVQSALRSTFRYDCDSRITQALI